MTSQIKSGVEYLTSTYNIQMFLLYADFSQNAALLAGYNAI